VANLRQLPNAAAAQVGIGKTATAPKNNEAAWLLVVFHRVTPPGRDKLVNVVREMVL